MLGNNIIAISVLSAGGLMNCNISFSQCSLSLIREHSVPQNLVLYATKVLCTLSFVVQSKVCLLYVDLENYGMLRVRSRVGQIHTPCCKATVCRSNQPCCVRAWLVTL